MPIQKCRGTGVGVAELTVGGGIFWLMVQAAVLRNDFGSEHLLKLGASVGPVRA